MERSGRAFLKAALRFCISWYCLKLQAVTEFLEFYQ